jgi:hypothetical protein
MRRCGRRLRRDVADLDEVRERALARVAGSLSNL